MTNIYTTMNLNSFSQSPVRGLEDEKLNLNKLPVKLESGTISAGDMVKIVAGNAHVPTIEEVASTDVNDGSILFGFVPLTRKRNKYSAGDMATIDLEGCVLYMIAGEDLDCGDAVCYDATSSTTNGQILKVPSSTTPGLINCGFALGDVKAGELVRVYTKY